VKLPSHGRYDYVPIHKRPQYEWPEGARLAVIFCNNVEYFAFGAGLGADPSGTPTPQNHRNYAWRDYGNRVGLWHYLDLLDEFGLPGAHNVNSAVLEACPDIVERLKGRGDEFVGHGRTNAEHQDSLWEDDEARLFLGDHRLQQLGHGQRLQLHIRVHVDAAVGAHGERRADRLLALLDAAGDGDDFRGLAGFLEAERLFHADLIEGVHGHLDVGRFDAAAVALHANLNVGIDDAFDRDENLHCRP